MSTGTTSKTREIWDDFRSVFFSLNAWGWFVVVTHITLSYKFSHLWRLQTVIALVYAAGLKKVYDTYVYNFMASDRFQRNHEECPSNSRLPASQTAIDERIRAQIPSKRKTLAPDFNSGKRGADDATHTKRSLPRWTIRQSVSRRLSKEAPGKLNMDHVELTCIQFMSAYIMIVPSVLMCQVFNLVKLAIRKWLHGKGLLLPKPCDYEIAVGKMCLETMHAIHYLTKKPDEHVAVFAFDTLPYPVKNEIKIAQLFTIDIDLDSKRMVKAMLDERKLTASETFSFLCFLLPFHEHPKVHALANWGVNTLSKDSYVRWNSCVTVMYNYFGFTTFTQATQAWQDLGVIGVECQIVQDILELGVQEGIPPHARVVELRQYSSFVNFIVGVRNGFLNEFSKRKDDLTKIDGEGLFGGTVLHSLDHQMFETTVEDPLWIDHTHEEFGQLAAIAQVARVGFSTDLPLLPFNRKFSNAPHSFYQTVYRTAYRINPWFADRMDTCIIK